jgi:hypothetical protein
MKRTPFAGIAFLGGPGWGALMGSARDLRAQPVSPRRQSPDDSRGGAAQMTTISRQICPKWTVGKIPTGEANSPQSGTLRRGWPPIMAIFKYVISRRNRFGDLAWHRACSLSLRGNWPIHPSHDLKGASIREATRESAAETVTRERQGPIQVPIAEASHSPNHVPDKCSASRRRQPAIRRIKVPPELGQALRRFNPLTVSRRLACPR